MKSKKPTKQQREALAQIFERAAEELALIIEKAGFYRLSRGACFSIKRADPGFDTYKFSKNTFRALDLLGRVFEGHRQSEMYWWDFTKQGDTARVIALQLCAELVREGFNAEDFR